MSNGSDGSRNSCRRRSPVIARRSFSISSQDAAAWPSDSRSPGFAPWATKCAPYRSPLTTRISTGFATSSGSMSATNLAKLTSLSAARLVAHCARSLSRWAAPPGFPLLVHTQTGNPSADRCLDSRTRQRSYAMEDQVVQFAQQLLKSGFNHFSERERRVITAIANRHHE
jgi:hypothetical protein